MYGLADRGGLFGVIYPAVSHDRGDSWRVDGPCFYFAAAQAANVVTTVDALSGRATVVWGRAGIFVRTTRDGGAHWWQTEMPRYVHKVGIRGDRLVAWMLASRALRTLAYVSVDGGLTWHLRFVPPLNARLFLSRRRVTPGHLIGVKATGCATLVDQRDEMTWHNHRQLTHALAGHYVPVFALHRQGTTITTSFRVPAHSPRGKALMDVYCGPASSGNAVGYVNVR